MKNKITQIFHFITKNRWNKQLIEKVLLNPSNARGLYLGNPQYYYNDAWVVLNKKCNRILKYKKFRKIK